jgi:hypothetical protein
MEQLHNKRRGTASNSPVRSKTQKITPSSGEPDNQNMGSGGNGTSIPRETANSNHPDGTDDNQRNDNNDTIYTFIIHKSAILPIPPTTKKAPTFAAFDHGDHIHFIYTTKHSNNANRSLNAILQFLGSSFEGTTEAHTALQPVRFRNRFLSYLIRKGIRSFHKYGNKRPTSAHLQTNSKRRIHHFTKPSNFPPFTGFIRISLPNFRWLTLHQTKETNHANGLNIQPQPPQDKQHI